MVLSILHKLHDYVEIAHLSALINATNAISGFLISVLRIYLHMAFLWLSEGIRTINEPNKELLKRLYTVCH